MGCLWYPLVVATPAGINKVRGRGMAFRCCMVLHDVHNVLERTSKCKSETMIPQVMANGIGAPTKVARWPILQHHGITTQNSVYRSVAIIWLG